MTMEAIPSAAFGVKEFCKRNSMARSTFYELLKAGALKAKKRGAKTIVLASDEQAWLNSLPDYSPLVG
jgi:predicted DNA-binding transcriptional regulator AlpA